MNSKTIKSTTLLQSLIPFIFVFVLGIISYAQAYNTAYYFNYPVTPPLSISLGFGESWDGHKGHLGEDYAKPENTPVYAVANGKVVNRLDEDPSWGNAIIIEHKLIDGRIIYSQYAHLNQILVNVNQTVTRGQKIGLVGKTGFATGYHLHFEIKSANIFGPGYTGFDFSGDQITYNGVTYYKPSTFIDSRCTIPLAGDWNGYGYDETGTYNTNTSTFYLGSDPIPFGELGDIPIIGDWDGDGIDEIGLFRPKKDHTLNEATFYLDLDNNGGKADKTIPFGPWSQDIPIAGDWDGDGDDDIGGYYPANSTFYLYIVDLNTSTASSYADVPLGQTGDIPISGDWDSDGDDDIGIFRVKDPNPNTNNFYFDIDLTGGQAEYNVTDFGLNGYGNIGDIPVIGDWDRDGDDNIGVYRPSNSQFYTRTDVPDIHEFIKSMPWLHLLLGE